MLPILYINLDRDQDRRLRMESSLSVLGLTYERLPGILWTDLSADEQARLYSSSKNARQFFRPLSDGEKGCYASHLKACEYLLSTNAPALVVLEDDVTFEPRFVAVLQSLAALPADQWDIIKLFSRQRELPQHSRPLDEHQTHQLVTYRRVPSWCNGYVISRAGATKILERCRPFGRPVDVDFRYWWEFDLRVYGVLPSVVAKASISKTSTIWRDGRPRRSWPQRFRRWLDQIDYTLKNAWHRRRQVLP